MKRKNKTATVVVDDVNGVGELATAERLPDMDAGVVAAEQWAGMDAPPPPTEPEAPAVPEPDEYAGLRAMLRNLPDGVFIDERRRAIDDEEAARRAVDHNAVASARQGLADAEARVRQAGMGAGQSINTEQSAMHEADEAARLDGVAAAALEGVGGSVEQAEARRDALRAEANGIDERLKAWGSARFQAEKHRAEAERLRVRADAERRAEGQREADRARWAQERDAAAEHLRQVEAASAVRQDAADKARAKMIVYIDEEIRRNLERERLEHAADAARESAGRPSLRIPMVAAPRPSPAPATPSRAEATRAIGQALHRANSPSPTTPKPPTRTGVGNKPAPVKYGLLARAMDKAGVKWRRG